MCAVKLWGPIEKKSAKQKKKFAQEAKPMRSHRL
jgi:hypothetical protein